jgi:hypothetical protein
LELPSLCRWNRAHCYTSSASTESYQSSTSKFFDRLDHRRPTPALVAHLHHAIIFSRRFHHHFALPRIVAAGLFHIQMFAGVAGRDRGGRLPMIRRSNKQCVEFFVF